MAYIEHAYCPVCDEVTIHVNGKCSNCEARKEKEQEKRLEEEFNSWYIKKCNREQMKELFVAIKQLQRRRDDDLKY